MTLTPAQQAPAAAVARVDVTDRTPAQAYREIATAEGFERALVDAVRELLAGEPHARRRVLEDVGVTAADGGYATVLTALDRPAEDDRHQEALETTARFGAAEASILGHLPLDAVTDGPLAALDAVDAEPTLAARIGAGFRERPHAERKAVLSLLARLGGVCDVRVVATGLTARWIAREHRDVLPAAFSDAVDAHRKEAPAVDDAVEAARDALDPDSREVSLLRRIAEEPAETPSTENSSRRRRCRKGACPSSSARSKRSISSNGTVPGQRLALNSGYQDLRLWTLSTPNTVGKQNSTLRLARPDSIPRSAV
ncbi:hypothetical protein ACFQL0_21805 [Haloplanus litoreus]|uniref:hypothetical protein n=1 Tax=Haloplanus litoreus TaxID=767515 RepID=UPI00360E510D